MAIGGGVKSELLHCYTLQVCSIYTMSEGDVYSNSSVIEHWRPSFSSIISDAMRAARDAEAPEVYGTYHNVSFLTSGIFISL